MKSFTKNDTQVMKGIAIILMFFHHNFLDADRYKGYVVNFWPFSETTVNSVTLSFKICVGIFVFLSAYGITLGMKNKNAEYKFTAKETSRMVCNRYLKLMGGYLFIFAFVQIYSVIAGFHRYHVMYGKGAKSVFYFLIDGLGLAELFGTPTFNATWWYMSFAILLVFIMPLLVQWYKKQGLVFLALLLLLPFSLKLETTYIVRYALAIGLGILCADKNLLARIRNFQIGPYYLLSKGIKFIAMFSILLLLFWGRGTQATAWRFIMIWDGVIPFVIIVFSFEFICCIWGIRHILSFIGKHSMNMFLTHTFLRAIWYPDFIYSFKSMWLITLVLLIVSLLVSIGIEQLKRLCRMQKLVDCVCRRADSFIENL